MRGRENRGMRFVRFYRQIFERPGLAPKEQNFFLERYLFFLAATIMATVAILFFSKLLHVLPRAR